MTESVERASKRVGKRGQGATSDPRLARTNERTDEAVTHLTSESLSSALRAGGLRESPSIFDFEPDKRAKVIRTGEREPISPLTRQLVYRRDDWTCQNCHARPHAAHKARQSGPLHLDHIIPWSAGGSDRSDNLRTYCGPCNMQRSNYVSKHDRPAMPIVRICAPCLCRDAADLPETAFEVYCACRHHVSWAIPGWHIL